MKQWLLLCVCLLLLCWPGNSVPVAAVAKDSIKIKKVTAAQPVVAGAENEFTVEVEYHLTSADQGELNIGFNSAKPDRYNMVGSRIVSHGAGTETLKAKVIPVDWHEQVKFKVTVNLSKYPHEMEWRTLADDRRDIKIGH